MADFYDLSVLAKATGQPIVPPLQPGPSPLGSFHAGEILDLRNAGAGIMKIAQVWHRIEGRPDGSRLHQTALIVEPVDPNANGTRPVVWPW